MQLEDGRTTTLHVVSHPLPAVAPRVVTFEPEAPLEEWAERHGVREAVSGGYAVKPDFEPLGEVWADGRPQPHQPFEDPWDARRAAFAVADGRLVIDRRDRLPERTDGDLLQMGPLLVRDGESAIEGDDDPEGFSSTAHEFDEDITANREPRLALALTGEALLVLAADGRAPNDAGLTLWELADLLVEMGAHAALNLDAGSAGVVISGGRRINTPRSDKGEEMQPSSPAVTAIVFE